MQNGKITIHQRAEIPLDTIPRRKRKKVFEALDALWELPPAKWPETEVYRLGPDEERYAVRVPGGYYVVFSIKGPGQFEIQDIFNERVLEYFIPANKEAGEST